MFLSIIYVSAIIVVSVTAITGAALYTIDKNAEENDEPASDERAANRHP
jgi:hypothetical protein